MINWTGGASSEVLTFQLMKGGAKVLEWTDITNSGNHGFNFPTALKPGKDYTFEVLDKNGVLAKSQSFSVTRKIPLALKISPFVITGVVILILHKDDKDFPNPPPPPN